MLAPELPHEVVYGAHRGSLHRVGLLLATTHAKLRELDAAASLEVDPPEALPVRALGRDVACPDDGHGLHRRLREPSDQGREPFSREDLDNIEAEMKKIIKEDLKIERFELSRQEAIKFMERLHNNY